MPEDHRRQGARRLLTRRAALGAVAAFAGLLSAVRPGSVGAALGPEDAWLEAVEALLRDRAAARAVGRAYLAAYPGLTRQDVLADLRRAVAGAGSAGSPSQSAIADRFDRAVRADFANGRTVIVDGWILSRTEAALYAVTSLRQA